MDIIIWTIIAVNKFIYTLLITINLFTTKINVRVWVCVNVVVGDISVITS